MIEWSIEQTQKKLEEICSAQKLVAVELTYERLPRYVYFKYPDRKLSRLAEINLDRTTRTAKLDKFLTEEEMYALMREKGIWTAQDDLKVESLQKLIALRKQKLLDTDIDETHKPYINEAIRKFEEELFQVEVKAERMLMHTVERRSRQFKYDYLLAMSTFDAETDEQLWENYLTYYENTETEFKNKLLTEFLRYLVGSRSEEIRYLARSNLWRITYLSSQKAGLSLFPKSAIELTPDQLNLIWWTAYYESIYQMLPEDQPDEYTIQDDEALDKYMEELHEERSRERSAARFEHKYKGGSASKMSERLIMKSHPDYQSYKYDKVNPHAKKATEISLKDDPKMRGQVHKKLKGLQKSRRFNPKES